MFWEHLTEGFEKAKEMVMPSIGILFLGVFIGMLAVPLSLYTFANQVNQKTAK